MREETVITAMRGKGFVKQQRELAEKGWRVIPGTVIIAAVWDEKARIDRWQYVAFFSRESMQCDGWQRGVHETIQVTRSVFLDKIAGGKTLNLCDECMSEFKEDMQPID